MVKIWTKFYIHHTQLEEKKSQIVSKLFFALIIVPVH